MDISWIDFFSLHLTALIEKLAPYYEKDFQDMLKRHTEMDRTDPALRQDFMKARILFEALHHNGAWGYRFEVKVPLVFKHPNFILKTLSDGIEADDGRASLFAGACADIDVLYSEIAAHIGLKGVTVRMTQANHVNVYVPLGDSYLRMDMTTYVGPSEKVAVLMGRPRWDLGHHDYSPLDELPFGTRTIARLAGRAAKRGPQDWKEKVLDPKNAKFEKGDSYYADKLRTLTLSPKVAEALLARLIARKQKIDIPAAFTPLIRGYRHAQGCYQRFMEQAPDSAAPLSRAQKAERRKSGKNYLECLESSATPLEMMGRGLGYCVLKPEGLSPSACRSETLEGFALALRSKRKTYHDDASLLSPAEFQTIQLSREAAEKWRSAVLEAPTRTELRDYLPWLDQKVLSSELTPLLISIIHLVSNHPSLFPPDKSLTHD